METHNPYQPPQRSVEKRHAVSLSSTDIFTIGAIIALLVLMFAPSYPHPEEYTAIEKILVALTWNWLTIVTTILGFGGFLTAICHVVVRMWTRFGRVEGASSASRVRSKV